MGGCNFLPTQVFACLPLGDNSTERGSQGCGVGCYSCIDTPSGLQAQFGNMNGLRWLMPHPIRPSRDARGFFSDWQCNVPLRVPTLTEFLRGVCFHQDGRECFDASYCDCAPESGERDGHEGLHGPPPGVCGTGENEVLAGARLKGIRGDCSFFSGSGWPPILYCRLRSNLGAERVVMQAGPLFQAAFGRYSDCTDNALIACSAKVHVGPCANGYGAMLDDAGQADGAHYNTQGFARWNQIFLRSRNWSLSSPDNAKKEERAAAHVKNRVLDRLKTDDLVFPVPSEFNLNATMNFAQLDNNAVFDNQKLGLFQREWEGAGNPLLSLERFPVLMEFPNCVLKNSGATVLAQLIAIRASISMHLVLHRRCDQAVCKLPVGVTNKELLLPSVRFRVLVTCGVRASLLSPATVHYGWKNPPETLSVTILNSLGGFPSVVAQGTDTVVDKIIYRHPGGAGFEDIKDTIFIPPSLVQWEGYLGEFSTPKWNNRWENNLQGQVSKVCNMSDNLNNYCKKIRLALEGLKVNGWPYASDSFPASPNTVYKGDVTLGFDIS